MAKTKPVDADIVAELALLVEESREAEAALLIAEDLIDVADLTYDERLEVAAEITAWLFGD